MHPAHRSSSKVTAPLVVAAALFTAAGGLIHLREWLGTYRYIPAAAPGSALVRVGFPLNAAVSAALAIALVGSAFWVPRRVPIVVAAAALFEFASLATLILSRTGSVFGWMEPVWTRAAGQTRAVEIGALINLAAVGALAGLRRRREPDAKSGATRESIPTAA